MRLLLVAGSPEPSSPALVARLASEADLVMAIDRGAEACRAAGVVPDAFCGDADTVSADTLAWVRAGVPGGAAARADDLDVTPADDVRDTPEIRGLHGVRGVRLFPPAKYDTDLSLGFSCARQMAAEAAVPAAADAAAGGPAGAAVPAATDAAAEGPAEAAAGAAAEVAVDIAVDAVAETESVAVTGTAAGASEDVAAETPAMASAGVAAEIATGAPTEAPAESPLEIVVTCASAGRMDHALAVFGVLAANADLAPRLVEDAFECRVLSPAGAASWAFGPEATGRHFSFVALADATVVSEHGLRWELDHFRVDALRDRGISNVVDAPDASVVCHAGTLAAFLIS